MLLLNPRRRALRLRHLLLPGSLRFFFAFYFPQLFVTCCSLLSWVFPFYSLLVLQCAPLQRKHKRHVFFYDEDSPAILVRLPQCFIVARFVPMTVVLNVGVDFHSPQQNLVNPILIRSARITCMPGIGAVMQVSRDTDS